ncbi:thiolase family protein [Aquincola sp. S2]|uniref:Thiolase family protein n=1 Tax=Pseudaquabacterium terrae TaxID=2732868 RepID=A0ABX2EUY4_9BURK|nr:thiolase family protein [Aquabacterium terrae]NRF72398.1 thiolase family protein [Aquabacterium terrae]
MANDIAIIGVGLHPFGRHDHLSAIEMGVQAARLAMADAGVRWPDIQVAYAGSLSVMMPETMNKFLGLTGIPFSKLFNGCATGGNLLLNVINAIRAGTADVGIAIGLDKHPKGAFSSGETMDSTGLPQWYGEAGLAVNPQFFAMKLQRYMHDFGITPRTLTRTAVKAFANGALNPAAWRRTALTAEEIDASRIVCDPLRKYHFCSPSDGAAAAVVCRADIAHRFSGTPIYVRAGEFRTRQGGSFDVQNPSFASRETPGASAAAARAAFTAAGIGPDEIDIVQVQDTEVGHELMHLAELGLCRDGEQEALVHDGVTERGGRLPVNTDGGLLANGEPIGASGLRQIHEICRQLRGVAGPHQVPRALKTGLTHVYGFPGSSCVTILSR